MNGRDLYVLLGSYPDCVSDGYTREGLEKAFDLYKEIRRKMLFGEKEGIEELADRIISILPNSGSFSRWCSKTENAEKLLIGAAHKWKDQTLLDGSPFGKTVVSDCPFEEQETIFQMVGLQFVPKTICKVANAERAAEEAEWMKEHDISNKLLLFHGSFSDSWKNIIKDDALDPTMGRDSCSFGTIEDDFGVKQGCYYSKNIQKALEYSHGTPRIVGLFDVPVGTLYEKPDAGRMTEFELRQKGCDSLSKDEGNEIVARRGLLKYLLIY